MSTGVWTVDNGNHDRLEHSNCDRIKQCDINGDQYHHYFSNIYADLIDHHNRHFLSFVLGIELCFEFCHFNRLLDCDFKFNIDHNQLGNVHRHINLPR
jgi:hypothetical protein